jgi:hypothetical protein
LRGTPDGDTALASGVRGDLHVRADGRATLRSFENRVHDVAERAGLSDIGHVRVLMR